MIYAAPAIVLAAIVYFCWRQNNKIDNMEITIVSDRLKRDVTVVHLSDMHSKLFGKGSRRLMDAVRSVSPDFICFTGDFLDRYTKEPRPAIECAGKLTEIAPVFYCPGNHDYHRANIDEILGELSARGVKVLRSEYARCCGISILGLDVIGYDIHTPIALREFERAEGFKLVMTHFPEQIEEFSHYDIDLVLAGHAHGGQFRLPIIGAVYAPGQGFFPKWTKGLYNENGRRLIVSPGLGNSGFPLRLGNPPTVITIKMKAGRV